MPSELVFSWLLALADPTGLRPPLPDGRLLVADFTTLCDLADRHGVLASFLANFKHATSDATLRPCSAKHATQGEAESSGAASLRITRDGPGRIVRSPRTFAASKRADDATARALADAERRLVQQTGMVLILRRQTGELAAALAEAGVPAVVLKGTDFADRLYPRPGLRLFRDVDILVSESARAQADLCMERLGYRPTGASLKYASGYGECGWRRPEAPPAGRMAGGTVEIHWDLVNSPSLRRAVSVPFEALQTERPAPPHTGHMAGGLPRLSPTSMLLVAAVHGATSHAFDRLQVLYDVAQAVRGAAGALDEAWLAEAAARTGGALALTAALALANKVVAEPRCGELLARLRLPPTTRLWKPVLTRGVVLRAHAPRDGLRRQAFRELLKRQ